VVPHKKNNEMKNKEKRKLSPFQAMQKVLNRKRQRLTLSRLQLEDNIEKLEEIMDLYTRKIGN